MVFFPTEIYINRNFDPIKSDIFTLGVSLFIIVCGIKPFNSSKRNDNLYKKYVEKIMIHIGMNFHIVN